MANILDYGLEVSEFELYLHCNLHFRKCMTFLIPQLNSNLLLFYKYGFFIRCRRKGNIVILQTGAVIKLRCSQG